MNIRDKFLLMVETYRPLFNETVRFYKKMENEGTSTHGHGLDHDLMVANYSLIITESGRDGALAWVAAMLHSIDRHCGDRMTEEVNRRFDPVRHLFDSEEIMAIMEAVENHSKRNDPHDGPVTVIIKDADRLANVGALNLIRGGQHRPNIPACRLETIGRLHPKSTFKEPMSCYDATFFNTEWWDMLRLPKARLIGEPHFEYTRQFRDMVESQFAEVGLDPQTLAKVGIV